MPFPNCRPALRLLARAASLPPALSASRARAARLATGAILAAVMLAPTSAAQAADKYRVEITNLRSGLKADVMWASTQPYQGVFLWPNNTSASQEFDLLDRGNGYFWIRARHSGQCLMLDWRRGPYTNGTRVIQYPCKEGRLSAEWRRGWASTRPICDSESCSSNGTEYPVLINHFTGRCLDADNGAGGAPPARAVLQQWTCIRYADDWNAGNQLWRIGNEFYL